MRRAYTNGAALLLRQALEVDILRRLEQMALGVVRSGQDSKWSQLNRILDDELMKDADGNRRKLIIFTEPKDTLFYLQDKMRARRHA